jgi:hypothetical protein
MKRLLWLVLAICGVAHAQYPYSPFPPTFPANTIGCNNTGSQAAPIECTVSQVNTLLGTVTATGSPASGQLSVFSGAGTITGYSGLTYNSSTGLLSSTGFSGGLTTPGGTWGSGFLATQAAPIIQVVSFSGTTTAATAAFGAYLQQADNSSCIPVSGNACPGFEEFLYLAGSSVVGPRAAGQFNLDIIAPTGNATTQGYVGLGAVCKFQVTDTPSGGSGCYGANFVASLQAGAEASLLVGAEIDVNESIAGTVGSISGYRAGFDVVDTSGSAGKDAQGALGDFGIGLAYANFNANTAGSTHGFQNGLTFGWSASYFPVSSTGTIIAACNNSVANGNCAYTVAKGIDFSHGTFTSWSYSDGINTLGPNGILTANLNGASAGSAINIGTNGGATYTGLTVAPGTGEVQLQSTPPSGNSDLRLASGGSGNVYLLNGSAAIALQAGTGGASFTSGDYVTISGVANGNQFAQVGVGGSDSLISLYLKSKGANGAVVAFPSSDGVAFQVKNAALSSTYFSVNTSSGAVTMPGLSTSSSATTGAMCWTTVTGNINVDTTTTCLLSDGRLKMNVEPLDNALAEVLQLKPVSYDLKPEVNPTHLGRQIGLIAQDVIKVDPRLAAVYQSGPDEGTPSGVRYEQLTAVLVKAIQQQQAEIERLKSSGGT